MCGTQTLEDEPNLLRSLLLLIHLAHLPPAHFPLRPAYEMPVLRNSTGWLQNKPQMGLTPVGPLGLIVASEPGPAGRFSTVPV